MNEDQWAAGVANVVHTDCERLIARLTNERDAARADLITANYRLQVRVQADLDRIWPNRFTVIERLK